MQLNTNTAKHAERELSILKQTVKKPIIAPFEKEILALCEAFGKSGQSGSSAPFTATVLSQAIKKLCLQEPICDITGVDDEWMIVADYFDGEEVYQNIRCSAVFKKGKSGKPHYLDAIVWKNQYGHTYTGSSTLSDGSKICSSQYIKKFPFKPKTFYIDRIDYEVAKDNWESTVKDEKQLDKVFKYYDRYAF